MTPIWPATWPGLRPATPTPPGASPSPTAKVTPLATAAPVKDPRVACDTLSRDDGTTFAVLVSHADEPLTVKPVLRHGSDLAALDGGQAGGSATLGPFGAQIFTVTGRDAGPTSY